MARLIRSLVVIGTIAVLSPVHEAASLREDAATRGRSLFASFMPADSGQKIEKSARVATQVARQIAGLDPETRELLLQLAASQLASAQILPAQSNKNGYTEQSASARNHARDKSSP